MLLLVTNHFLLFLFIFCIPGEAQKMIKIKMNWDPISLGFPFLPSNNFFIDIVLEYSYVSFLFLFQPLL
jgi:hypothetical protein